MSDPFTCGHCVACDSPWLIVLRNVGTSRTRRTVPLRFCLHCRTMSCAADYREDEAQLKADADYHAGLAKSKRPVWDALAAWLGDRGAKPPGADIGCGVGGLADAMRRRLGEARGYDLNPFAISEGRRLFPDASLACEPFGQDGRTFGLITSIDTFEHLAEPFTLMRQIAAHLRAGGLAYLSVPRVDEELWGHLRDPVESQFDFANVSPFRDTDVHVTHFSSRGLVAMGDRAGLRLVGDFAGKGWPMDGVLFQK